MRGPQQKDVRLNSTSDDLHQSYAEDSVDLSHSSQLNPLDQAFVIYSDDDMVSLSSQSHKSSLFSDSRSVALSRHSRVSQRSHKPKSEYSNSNILGQFANEESSIIDVRESQCSDSGRELINNLEELFGKKHFLRRSPRLVSCGQQLNEKTVEVIERQYRFKKPLNQVHFQYTEMIKDQKCQLNQPTPILQEKQKQFVSVENTKSFLPVDQKPSESSFQPQIFPVVRQTRSSKKLNNFESESTYSNNSRLTGQQSTTEYLSRQTKDFILTLRKQKKIKKALKSKTSSNGVQKVRQCNLRHH